MPLEKGLQVNLSLLPVKITYFTFFAAIAVLLPFIPVYMKQLGLTPAESAIILSVTTASTGLTRAIIGMIADKFRIHRLMIFACCVFGGLFHFFILFVPSQSSKISDPVVWKVCCRNNLLYACDEAVGRHQWASPDSNFLSSNNLSFALHDSLWNTTKINNVGHCVLNCCTQNKDSWDNVSAIANHSSCHWVANLTTESSYNITVGVDMKEICSLSEKENCSVVCEHLPSSNMVQDSLPSKFQQTFIIVFILFFLGQSAFSPIFSLLDCIVYVYLGDRRGEFGKQRLWGTVGFGLFALTSGWIMDVLKQTSTGNDYLFSFVTFLLLLVMTGLTVYFYKITPESSTGSMWRNLRQLFCNFYLIVLFMAMLVAGMMAGVLEAFFFWFLKNLKASQLLLGLALLVSCITETIVLFFSGKIIAKFGFSLCLYVVFAVFSVRFLANSFIENPWIALATEATQCICFGLLYPTVTSWGSALTPPGMQGTIQSIIGAMYLSIGRAIGAALGGAFYETYGPRSMFRIFAVVSFVFLIILVILLETAKRRFKTGEGVKVEDGTPTSGDEVNFEGNRMNRDETADFKEDLLDIPTSNYTTTGDDSKEITSLVDHNTTS